ncbi:hypothetical protein D3C84_567290 [compost metagenome]
MIELEAAHVDVPQVEISLWRIHAGEAGQCQVEISRVISGYTFPERIDKQRRRLGEMLMLEGPATLLVPGKERVGQRIGLGRRRLQPKASGQQQTGHPVQAPAFAHADEGDQQQRPAQPVTGIFPVQFALFVAGRLEVLLCVQFDPVEIVIVECQAAQRRVQRRGQLLDCRRIETAELRATVAVGARLPAGVMDDAVVSVADGEDQHLQLAALQFLVQPGQCRGVRTVGDQQQGAGSLFRREQAFGLVDDGPDIFPRLADQVSTQGLDERVEQGRIVGGRQYQMRAASVSDQRVTRTGTALNQVVKFVFGGLQATRRNIAGVHRR